MALENIVSVGLHEDASVWKMMASEGQCIPLSPCLPWAACFKEPTPDADNLMAVNEILV